MGELDAITFKVCGMAALFSGVLLGSQGLPRGAGIPGLHRCDVRVRVRARPITTALACKGLIRSAQPLCPRPYCSPQAFVESKTSNQLGRQLMYWLYCEANGGYSPASVSWPSSMRRQGLGGHPRPAVQVPNRGLAPSPGALFLSGLQLPPAGCQVQLACEGRLLRLPPAGPQPTSPRAIPSHYTADLCV